MAIVIIRGGMNFRLRHWYIGGARVVVESRPDPKDNLLTGRESGGAAV